MNLPTRHDCHGLGQLDFLHFGGVLESFRTLKTYAAFELYSHAAFAVAVTCKLQSKRDATSSRAWLALPELFAISTQRICALEQSPGLGFNSSRDIWQSGQVVLGCIGRPDVGAPRVVPAFDRPKEGTNLAQSKGQIYQSGSKFRQGGGGLGWGPLQVSIYNAEMLHENPRREQFYKQSKNRAKHNSNLNQSSCFRGRPGTWCAD